jgi:ATP-dependent protease ClpP protease subunit
MLWKYKKTCNNKRLKTSNNTDDEEESNESSNIKFPFSFQKNSNNYINTCFNHIYFNNDITSDSIFELCKEIRNVEIKIKTLTTTINIDKIPIYLHITTNGGCIHSAFSVIDCIKTLSVPVYTVVDGFVASAGTLISLSGEKRYMCENAYMLIHELRGGIWGKMSEIEEDYTNSKKLMEHIIKIYAENTNIKKKKLDNLLKKDLIWDVEECMKKGLIHEIYKPS